jgi:spermidine/putrescine transport system permease protein
LDLVRVLLHAPLLWIIYYSFGYKPNIFHPIATDKLSFDRYREGFSGAFVHVFSQTLQISILGTVLCLLIGFPFAYWLATRVTARWRGVLLGLVIVPFFVNFLIRTIGWLILLAPPDPCRPCCRIGGSAVSHYICFRRVAPSNLGWSTTTWRS